MLKRRRRNELRCRIDVTALLSIQLAILFLYFVFAGQVHESGISVELPKSRHFVAAPEADSEDALVVTITYDGKIYFEMQRLFDPKWLSDRLQDRLGGDVVRKVYFKVDARARYCEVREALEGVRLAGIERVIFLTQAPRRGMR